MNVLLLPSYLSYSLPRQLVKVRRVPLVLLPSSPVPLIVTRLCVSSMAPKRRVELTEYPPGSVVACGRPDCPVFEVELTVEDALERGYSTVIDNIFGNVERVVCAPCLIHYELKMAAAQEDANAEGSGANNAASSSDIPHHQGAQQVGVFVPRPSLRAASNAAKRGSE